MTKVMTRVVAAVLLTAGTGAWAGGAKGGPDSCLPPLGGRYAIIVDEVTQQTSKGVYNSGGMFVPFEVKTAYPKGRYKVPTPPAGPPQPQVRIDIRFYDAFGWSLEDWGYNCSVSITSNWIAAGEFDWQSVPVCYWQGVPCDFPSGTWWAWADLSIGNVNGFGVQVWDELEFIVP